MMYTVLLPVDENVSRALDQAQIIEELSAASESVHVTLLRVFDEPAASTDSDMADPMRVKSVAEVKERLEAADVSFEIRGEVGDTVETIVSVADEIEANSIIMGGRNRSPVGKAILGSVSQDVILNADRPVIISVG